MRGVRSDPYVRGVRVVIDFNGSQPGHWAGLLRAEDDPAVEAGFEGRLDLLRLLEGLVDRGHVPRHIERELA